MIIIYTIYIVYCCIYKVSACAYYYCFIIYICIYISLSTYEQCMHFQWWMIKIYVHNFVKKKKMHFYPSWLWKVKYLYMYCCNMGKKSYLTDITIQVYILEHIYFIFVYILYMNECITL